MSYADMYASAHPCKVIATSGSHLCSPGGQGDKGGVVLSKLGAGQSQLIARRRLNASLIATAAVGRSADLGGRPKQHVCLDASGGCHFRGLQQSQHVPQGLYKGAPVTSTLAVPRYRVWQCCSTAALQQKHCPPLILLSPLVRCPDPSCALHVLEQEQVTDGSGSPGVGGHCCLGAQGPLSPAWKQRLPHGDWGDEEHSTAQ